MNREDAAREIDNTACCFSDKRFRDAMHMAAAALREAKRRAEGCVECNWIDPGLAWTGEDKPVYCKRCGRCLHDPQQNGDKTHIIPEQV